MIPPGPMTPWVRRGLIALTLLFLGIFLILPAVALLGEAFSQGGPVFVEALAEPNSLTALGMTLLCAGIAVPLNLIFGIAAAWAIARFEFRGKGILVTLIDIPFATSPVIGGMVFLLLFGAQGLFGGYPERLGIPIVFAAPGMVLATCFVTFPLVARELIPFMQSLGNEREEAAAILGANGWQIFRRVTLPSIRWGLLYGVVLCNARAMGEFGAVSVVSGHIRGATNTLPLHIEILYDEYLHTQAFAVASVLLVLALVTLVAKQLIEWRIARQIAQGEEWRG